MADRSWWGVRSCRKVALGDPVRSVGPGTRRGTRRPGPAGRSRRLGGSISAPSNIAGETRIWATRKEQCQTANNGVTRQRATSLVIFWSSRASSHSSTRTKSSSLTVPLGLPTCSSALVKTNRREKVRRESGNDEMLPENLLEDFTGGAKFIALQSLQRS